MGHGKLKKFAENLGFHCLLQPSAADVLVKEEGLRELKLRSHAIRGNWNRDMFEKPAPIVLELGCGKGDYTIALAKRHPEMNFIGVDIKGARLWSGAKTATGEALPNVAFLRTRVEFLEAFFAPGEVSAIWLTFSDPQLHGSENARLSSHMFLERYRKFLSEDAVIHLKTDSRFLHEYTMSVIRANKLRVLAKGTDIYGTGLTVRPENEEGWDLDAVFQVQTFYEKMFLQMGLPITYLAFSPAHEGPYVPAADFDKDYWLEAEGPRRSFSHQ